jgi:hypothetical protein
MKKNIRSHKLIGFGVSLASYLLFLGLTKPAELPLPVLLVPSIIFGVMLYFLSGLLISLMTKKKSIIPISVGIFASIIAMLASLGQLTIRDIILSGLLLILFIFYFQRSSSK